MSVASSLSYCYSLVDEDLLDKNLMSVASSLLYCYSVVCWWSDWGYGYKRLC